MIDFHSHIIYDVDDGAKDIEMSAKLLEISRNDGVNTICATSHYVCGVCEQDRDIYNSRLEEIRKLTSAQVVSGLEVRIVPEIVDRYEEGKIWGINDKKYMLLELPFEEIPKYTMDVIYELRIRGVKPVLAHPERNAEIMKNPKILNEFIEEGVLMQVCRGSIFGRHGSKCAKISRQMVKNNMVHLLGSDAHNIHDRDTELKSAYDFVEKLNPELFKWICENQNSVLEGSSVKFPKTINKWGLFR